MRVLVFFAVWPVWVLFACVFGRLFCRWFCPLGLSQSLVNRLFHPKSHVRRVCTRLPRPWYQRAVNWALVAAYFAWPVGCFIDPWGIFGRALTACLPGGVMFVPGLVLFGAVLVLAAFGKGRIWCNWVCPMGTLYDLASKLAPFGDQVGKGCGKCRACLAGRS